MPRKTSTMIALILLLAVPAFLNIYTPLYNSNTPYLDGLPYFYWFQILLLLLCIGPYLAFTYIERKSSGQES
ncbi:MAG: hypothetical protein JRN20_20915 [Nitrososphaerota archaeon]|nr:hypothetical protein [Nitrososphaerota archaeon]